MSVDFITSDMSGVTHQINHLNETVNSDRNKNQVLLEQQNEVKEILEKEKENIQKKLIIIIKLRKPVYEMQY